MADIEEVKEKALDFAAKTGFVYWTNEIKSIELNRANWIWTVLIESFRKGKKQDIIIQVKDDDGKIISFNKV